jgi:tetratricopeptide (TPR) repeat protein
MKSPKPTPSDQAAITRILTLAVGHIAAGRFDEAKQALGVQGGLALRTPVGRNILGDIFLKTGKHREALKSFDRALKLAPSFPEAHANRGVVLQEMGRLAEALRAQGRALRLRSGYPMASYNRGNILKEMKRFDEAVSAYDLALKSCPDFAEALLNRGDTYLRLDQPMNAMADFRSTLALDGKNLGAIIGRASALRAMGHHGDALESLGQALVIDPHHAQSLILKNEMERDGENYTAALETITTLVEAEPGLAQAHEVLAITLQQVSRHEEALRAVDEAIRLNPNQPGAHVVRCIILGDMGRYDEQMVALRRAEKSGADGARLEQARGQAFAGRGAYDAAISAFQKASDLDASDWQTRRNLAFLQLSLGNLAEGWPLHEARLEKSDHPQITYDKVAPRWTGEDLTSRKVLVFFEQGYGDTLQFLRFLTPLAAQGADITFLAPEPLKNLLAENLPGIDVTDSIGLRKGFDFQISLMSLPAVFKTSLETLPGAVPYIRAAGDRVDKWARRIGKDGFRVGLVWQGNPNYPGDRTRSIPLKHFAPLAEVPGVRLISLQVFHGLDQLDQLPAGMKVERLGEEVVNNPGGFREVAAVMANLDLLVTSDTGPAHLAGAMGRPVWVALRDRPDWRWLMEREDSPWYPTMRLFRQKIRSDWTAVFEEVAAALADRVSASGGSAASP